MEIAIVTDKGDSQGMEHFTPTRRLSSGYNIMNPMQLAEITDLIFLQNHHITLLTSLVKFLANSLYASYASVYFTEYNSDKEHFMFSMAPNPKYRYADSDNELRLSNNKCGGCIYNAIRSGDTSSASFQCGGCDNSTVCDDFSIARFPFRTDSLFCVLTIAQDNSSSRDFNVYVFIHALLVLVAEKINSLFLSEQVKFLKQSLEAQRSVRQLGENATYAIHETKNLVSTIYGGVQLAHAQILNIFEDKSNRFSPASAKYFSSMSEAISLSMKAGNKFFAFLNDWQMNLSKIDRKMVLLNDVVKDALFETKACTKNNLAISYEDTGEEFYVETDPTLLERAIVNILLNSINAVKDIPSPKIDVKLSCDDLRETCLVFLRDNGVGITKERINNIMENKQVEQSAKSFSGKGMWITKTILDSLGANLKIESQLGVGTELLIAIPISDGLLKL